MEPSRRPNVHARRPRLEPLEGRVVLSYAFDSVVGIGDEITNIGVTDNAVDGAGNVYVVGTLNGPMDFDPSVIRPDGSDILTPRGSTDAFVAKYAPDNRLVWARRMGGDYVRSGVTDTWENARSVAVDGAGNVYVTGNFNAQGDFGRFTLTSAGSTDVFVAKLDAGGAVLWANRWGGSTRDYGMDVAVDAAGNVVSAAFTATATSSGGWIGSGFEARKYSPTGSAVWSKRVDNRGGSVESVATDAAGNVYFAGKFNGVVDFNPDPKKSNLTTGASGISGELGANAYVLKLTSAGAYGWVAPLIARSSGAGVGANALAVDGAGNVILGGRYHGQVDFNPSSSIDYRLPDDGIVDSSEGFVAKLTSSGSFRWATPFLDAVVEDLAVDSSGEIFATGTFHGEFAPGSGLPAMPSIGQQDAFVVRLAALGAANWATTVGGTWVVASYAIALDSSGTIYLAGNYSGTADFDPDPLGIHELTNPTKTDAFLLKLRRV